MNTLSEPIAIIGIAGRFPGSRDVGRFWENLSAGREMVRFPSGEELLAKGVPASALSDPAYVKAEAGAPDVEYFDADLFGFTPREADLTDPQIKLFLEAAHGAVENAGYDPHRLSEVGVFGSTGINRYTDSRLKVSTEARRSTAGMSIGVLANPDYVATLVSYKYGFRGPSMTVQTACSSAMVAVHLAAQSLRAGECDLALAGGSEVEFPIGHGHWWAPGGPLSRDGHCRPFSAQANGTIFGSGVGVVLLKRLPDAIAAGDTVRAIIRSIAVNNDGSDKVGFAAPGVTGQSEAMAEAMALAGVTPDQLDVVELHATGTILGDPVEVAALKRAFAQSAEGDLDPGRCLISSVKGNVGHLGHAAGATSLIKMVLSLEHEYIPPSINVGEPNPKLELDSAPFSIVTEGTAWPRTAGRPRMAGLNSLGIGGTNVHAILEEAPAPVRTEPDGRPRLVVWSGRSESAEHDHRERLAGHFDEVGDGGFVDTVTTLQRGRTEHEVRAAVVASTAAEAAAALRARPPIGGHAGAETPRTAFLFPGQGSQHVAMAHDLYASEPLFASVLDECLAMFDEHGVPVGERWRKAASDAELEPTEVAQPLLFAVEYALSELWSAWGVAPDALLGHSIGELTAATVAGVFDLADAVSLVAARSLAMRGMPRGGMLAVAAGVDDVRPLLPGGLTVAAVNGERQTVVAGAEPDLDAFAAVLAESGSSAQRLSTSHAFHSPAMRPAAEEFERAFDGVALRAPKLPMYSAASGALLTEAEATDPAFWARQLTEPVLFDTALTALLSERRHCLVEVGPGYALTALARLHPAVAGGDRVIVPSLPPQRNGAGGDRAALLTALGTLWAQGRPVDWGVVEQAAPPRRLPMPGYPYARTRHWIDLTDGQDAAGGESAEHGSAGDGPAPALDAAGPAPGRAASAFGSLTWQESPREPAPAAAGPGASRRVLVLLPDDRERSVDLVVALQRAGLRPILARPGERFVASDKGFEVRPGSADDLAALFDALAERGERPEVVVHASTVGAWDPVDSSVVADQLDDSCLSLLGLVRHAVRTAAGRLPELLVVTERSVDVSGCEQVDPVKATLHGLVRTLNEEEPALRCRLVDIAARVDEENLVAELAELAEPGGHGGQGEQGGQGRAEVVALRGDRRWVRAEREFTAAPADRPALRPEGVYLITGGLGGLGLAVARELAHTGLRPRLVLLGRRGLAGPDDHMATVRAAIEEMEALGARVKVMACDVTDERALRRAVDVATAELGQVSGVLHLAGVAGDGMLQVRTREQVDAVMAPKVLGTVLLHETFARRPPLDFFVSFSSRAAVGGLVGGGDYAAANAFQDAFAAEAGPGRHLSINWPAWASVGMAAVAPVLPTTAPPATAPSTPTSPSDADERRVTWRHELSAATHPVLDEHRIGATPVLPGTAHLDFVVRAFRAEAAADGTAPVTLKEVVFQRPLAVPGERLMEITFTSSGDRWRFAVRSVVRSAAADAPEEEPQVHATGLISAGGGPRPRAEVDALLARFPERGGPPGGRGGVRLVTLGPRWGNIEAVLTGPDHPDERIFMLALPDVFADDLADHALHPTLLDSATAYARDSLEVEPHLPFLYESMVVHAALPQKLLSHIRRRPAGEDTISADIDLIAEDGQVLVEIRGFAMRRIRDDAAGFESTMTAAAVWPAGTGARGADGTPGRKAGPPAGLEPDTGVLPDVGARLLLELLDASTPNQVTVRPFRGGLPVPIAVVPATAVAVAEAVPAAPEAGPAGARPSAADGRLDDRAGAAGAAAPAPGSGTVDTLRSLWTESLGVVDIAEDADFFDLGGNSLVAVELITKIRETFAVELGIAAIFDHPTLVSLADELSRIESLDR